MTFNQCTKVVLCDRHTYVLHNMYKSFVLYKLLLDANFKSY